LWTWYSNRSLEVTTLGRPVPPDLGCRVRAGWLTTGSPGGRGHWRRAPVGLPAVANWCRGQANPTAVREPPTNEPHVSSAEGSSATQARRCAPSARSPASAIVSASPVQGPLSAARRGDAGVRPGCCRFRRG
jgi:hypothetical protein